MVPAVTKLHALFGARIAGLDLSADLDDPTIRFISDTIASFGVLVFCNQHLSTDQQVAFARRFGVPETSTQAYRPSEKLRLRPEMADVSNLDVEGRTRGRDDRQRMFSLGNQLWHTDSSFREVPGALSILHLHGAPPSWGGETEFTDMRVAYDALPARRKASLDGLVAEHSLMHSRSLLGFADFSAEERAAMPPVRQPVVRRHEGSGRKTLYLASHASHIIGMPVPDGRMLLRDLIEFATQREFVHTHSWAEGDLVMWDNRCTLHRGRAYDEMEKRDLRRVTTSDARPGIEMAA